MIGPEIRDRIRAKMDQPVAFICAVCGNPLSHRPNYATATVFVSSCLVCFPAGLPAEGNQTERSS